MHKQRVLWCLCFLVFLFAFVLSVNSTSTSSVVSNDSDGSSSFLLSTSSTDDCTYNEWEEKGGFMIWLFLMCYMWLGFAVLCDEFFLPALNIFCEKLQMSDDVAGATLMAAGAGAPDVFSSIIGVCIMNSDIGVGTVVGSLLFNHLAIIGACGLFAGAFVINLRQLLREAIFYTGAIIFLIIVLYDNCVDWWEALLMVILYGLYVVVCVFYNKFLIKINRYLPKRLQLHSIEDGSLLPEGESYTFTEEPNSGAPKVVSPINSPKISREECEKRLREGNAQAFNLVKENGGITSGSNIGFDYGDVIMHSYLFIKSAFYSKLKINAGHWQKKWFTLAEDFAYCSNPLHPEKKRIEIELDHLDPRTFVISLPFYRYSLRAKTEDLAKKWAAVLAERVRFIREHCPDLYYSKPTLGALLIFEDGGQFVEVEDEEESVLAWPASGSVWRKTFYIVRFPLAVLYSITIPDKRWHNWFVASFISVLVWLALMAYTMVWCALRFACIFGIPDDVMGLTVLAIGASLPSCFSSMLAAKKGLANMAVSNAFGSNIFSIFISFAFPVLLRTLIVTPFEPYRPDTHSILLTAVAIAAAMVFFFFVEILARFRINRPIGGLFLLTYVVLICGILVVTMVIEPVYFGSSSSSESVLSSF